MSTKFREIKVRGRYFSWVLKFANFLKSRKSRIWEPAKIKENKVGKNSQILHNPNKICIFDHIRV